MYGFTNCTKTSESVPEQDPRGAEITASIEDVDTKTSLNGVDVTWAKDDEIAIQLSSIHTDNYVNHKDNRGNYPATLGIYKLSDDAAGTKSGKFTFSSGDETIGDDDTFFAFYPAEYCHGVKDNGYFYLNFPTTQYYEDNIGTNLSLPMYGIGRNREINFKYAGAVLKFKVWSKTETRITSCTISNQTGIPSGEFSYINDKKEWTLANIYNTEVPGFTVKMREPLALSTDEKKPTEIAIVIPLTKALSLTSLSLNVNAEIGGCQITKKSALTVAPGDAVTFHVKELSFVPNKLIVDGVEGDVDVARIQNVKSKIALVTKEGGMLSEETFKAIIDKTKELDHQIIVDFSKASVNFSTIVGLASDNQTHIGFCGGWQNQGLKNISEFWLPEGLTNLGNMSLAGSEYTKVVVPSTLTSISGFPTRYSDKMVWEVNENNKKFKAYNGALYDFDMKQLMVLNGGSGAKYVIPEGVESIRNWTMYDNSVLTTLTLPSTMKILGTDSIDGANNLSTIICLGSEPATLGKQQTVGKAKEKIIYVPGKSVEKYQTAWKELIDKGWTVKTLEDAKNAGFTITTPESESLAF